MTDVHPMAWEYAVGDLSADEAQEFETHLPTCPDCRKEVADMRDIALQLSEAVATDPPPGLRSLVLAQIASTPQYAPSRQPEHISSVPSDASGSTGSNVVPLQRRSRGSWAAGLLAAAAVVAAIAMGGLAIQNRNDARDATAQAEQLTQLLAARDVQTVSGDFANSGVATVVVSARQGRALLVAADLPALPSGKTYEAWAVKDTMVPAGTFVPDGSTAVVDLAGAAVDATGVAVTIEPEGGSQQPTADPVFRVDLSEA
ncbi:MAG: anti-sigma factor [Propionibacteriales bacterium]|nr:anti-sigma factor [Propionibacteriales bacterium]